MPRYPKCSDCNCDMQLFPAGWRCPWTSPSGRDGRRREGRCGWKSAPLRVAMIFERSAGR